MGKKHQEKHHNKRLLTELAVIRTVTANSLSDVRHLHALSFRTQGAEIYTKSEIDAFTSLVYSTSYMDRIASAACYGAWIDTQLSGTCSWEPSDDDGPTARIRDLFVNPLYARSGLGHMLLDYTEAAACDAGFTSFSARMGLHAAPVFERFGYAITSYGVYHLTDEMSIDVVSMRKSV